MVKHGAVACSSVSSGTGAFCLGCFRSNCSLTPGAPKADDPFERRVERALLLRPDARCSQAARTVFNSRSGSEYCGRSPGSCRTARSASHSAASLSHERRRQRSKRVVMTGFMTRWVFLPAGCFQSSRDGRKRSILSRLSRRTSASSPPCGFPMAACTSRQTKPKAAAHAVCRDEGTYFISAKLYPAKPEQASTERCSIAAKGSAMRVVASAFGRGGGTVGRARASAAISPGSAPPAPSPLSAPALSPGWSAPDLSPSVPRPRLRLRPSDVLH
mmetsp:Transcript_28714/g.84666  ORF Transcript_28714/g.84666 Transcript_28714/m.84666 type:complete len:273 (-) Transcript_28714:64-882(-)